MPASTPLLLFALLIGAPTGASAQALDAPPSMAVAEAYTRYELLPPGSGKFRILYEVTQTEPGAVWFFNPIRKGSTASEMADGRTRLDFINPRPDEIAVTITAAMAPRPE